MKYSQVLISLSLRLGKRNWRLRLTEYGQRDVIFCLYCGAGILPAFSSSLARLIWERLDVPGDLPRSWREGLDPIPDYSAILFLSPALPQKPILRNEVYH